MAVDTGGSADGAMVTAAASPVDILRAVERYTVATGRHRHLGERRVDQRGWVVVRSDAEAVVIRHYGNQLLEHDGQWLISPTIALAFCLLLASGAASVDVGQCPACVARSLPGRKLVTVVWAQRRAYYDEARTHNIAMHEWAERLRVALDSDGWTIVRTRHDMDEIRFHAFRTCPTCTGTGRETIPAERLLLDAVSGDSNARDRLLVHADQLQASGDPLGLLLAWALGPWSGEPVDCGECPGCNGRGSFWWDGEDTHPPGVVECPACSGTGRHLGHPHTAEAVAWLDRLTDAREDANEEADEERRLENAFSRERERQQRQSRFFTNRN